MDLELAADQEDNHKEDVHIPPELFAKNVALKRLWITIDHTPERRVYLSEDAFAENTNLANEFLSRPNISIPSKTTS